jgi:hypothetical protein
MLPGGRAAGREAMRDDETGRGADATTKEPAVPRDLGLVTEEDFTALLLHALLEMAGRSKRRQADLTAALHGAGLPADPPRVRAALRILRRQGCIEKLVPLSDGGLLLSVTPRAMDRLGPAPGWLPLGGEEGEE